MWCPENNTILQAWNCRLELSSFSFGSIYLLLCPKIVLAFNSVLYHCPLKHISDNLPMKSSCRSRCPNLKSRIKACSSLMRTAVPCLKKKKRCNHYSDNATYKILHPINKITGSAPQVSQPLHFSSVWRTRKTLRACFPRIALFSCIKAEDT